ncbi:Rne/Rng family ribonuclease [Clostridium pasteurianum]|uniref:Rne/Rng family ribonuclease n=1 Tax=Clostridium pasteurianum TaxID=1501 RepID=UPI00353135FE
MKNIFVERQDSLLRIAITEKDKLIGCHMEEEGTEVYPGQIYKGIVKNIVPAIKCAFIDIGRGKNGYMYMDSKFNNVYIKKGQEILVEIIKESMGSKGPKVTNKITVPGRYAVIETLNNEISISKKIVDSEVQNYLRKNIQKPDNTGVMLRTNAEKVPIDEINDEIKRLYEIYQDIVRRSKLSSKPEIIYNDDGALGKVLRDLLDEYTEEVIVNSEKDFHFIENYIKNKKDIKIKLERHNSSIPIMEYYSIEKKILELRNNTVELHCGGSIVIDKTEAMYVIDVNSGKNVRQRNIKNTAEITNIEAAREIPLQIRLRNLSGIIVIDFIDLEDDEVKNKILNILENGFKEDKNKTIVYPFTELNIVQIARRRRGKSILDYIEQRCGNCNGSGKVLKLSYLSNLIRNNILRLDSESENFNKHIYIEVNDEYRNIILNHTDKFIKSIAGEDKNIYVKFIKSFDTYKVFPLIYQSQIEEKNIYRIYG